MPSQHTPVPITAETPRVVMLVYDALSSARLRNYCLTSLPDSGWRNVAIVPPCSMVLAVQVQ